MTWAKVDDHANEHRKQIAAGAEACWLWTCGLMYANRQAARDGFIPTAIVGMLYPFKGPAKLAQRLVDVGLWVAVEGGYQVHQFTTWNQTKEQREHELEQGRLRAAKSHALRAKTSPSSGEDTERRRSEDVPKLQKSSGSTPTPTPIPVRDLTAAADPKDPKASARQEPTKPEIAATAAGNTRVLPRDPNNMAEALEMALEPRAQLLLRNPHAATWVTPESWPEVRAIATCMAKATGKQALERLSGYSRDVGVQAVVTLFAAGYSQADVEHAVAVVTQSDWWRKDNRSRGLSSLTPEVVRRAHAESPRSGELDPKVAQLLREREARLKANQEAAS